MGKAAAELADHIIITSDNDFRDGQDTRVWVFACEDKDLNISAVETGR